MVVRIWGINFGLPYLYHPDEPNKVIMAQTIFKTGDLNPHYFLKPSFLVYLNALAYVPYYLVGKLAGVFESAPDIPAPIVVIPGVGRAPMPTTFLMGRVLTAIFGCVAVALAFLLGRRLTGRTTAGLMAALMMAVSPTLVALSRFITPDMMMTFFILLATYGSLRVLQEGKTSPYILAGVATGLAASAKYYGAIVLISVVVANFARYGWKGFKERRLYLAGALSVVTFFLITPFALLDAQKFLADLLYETRHYSTGHQGMEGGTLSWYLGYLWHFEGPVSLMAALAILRGFYTRSKRTLVIISFPLVYFSVASSLPVRNDRTLLPLIPFLFLLASSLLVALLEWADFRRLVGKLMLLGTVAVFLVSLTWPILRTVKNTIELTAVDSRETGRVWIDRNLPDGARVAIEAYAPYVDPQRFSVQGFRRMIDHTPDWYVDNGFEYLVFGQGMYGRFYEQPQRYADEASRYMEIFGVFHSVATFTDGEYEVRVYSTNLAGPSHEVMADFGGLVRFVGYYMGDGVAGEGVTAGSPLEFTLYWQRLAEMEKQYSVFVHLVDDKWRMVGQSDGVPQTEKGVTGAGGWGDGQIVEDRRTIELPTDAAEGEHRLEIGVYDPETMERLTLRGSVEGDFHDRVLAVPIRVHR
jgi:MFS family permease